MLCYVMLCDVILCYVMLCYDQSVKKRCCLWWIRPLERPYIEGGLDRYLHYVHHGVLEEDEVHMSATNRLVVLTHEHPQSFLENLVIR